ncbi:RplU [Desulforapulum autotrophicum HRM2]|uniref:Large ribosomal subunit protein bL21 n=1 Tax=Desulforapulum autotrophicum (strain ATCC 43914 / DSM 3382 / VKM B-1955 / HRM2) TaxID=177437 RepID=RL21_DESAH|nr:50S ribosomal protein L21 [Desulforapulum autotrophicum]C0QLE7.1 RecName: Full=Large ribosomal subunit protein bL21; AltName: Full=50S ribosomal protein L21 [Desulforapulum autotrophicum HRM2]ACN16251.1 RplU [Desulforapulum autotrophicum HRM2]
MYAVIKTGGKQYKVQEGDTLRVEKLEGTENGEIEFNDVLMFSDGENVTLGQPAIEDAIVKGHILEQGKGKKVLIFKFKRRKGYRNLRGHRQQYTAVKIDSILV